MADIVCEWKRVIWEDSCANMSAEEPSKEDYENVAKYYKAYEEYKEKQSIHYFCDVFHDNIHSNGSGFKKLLENVRQYDLVICASVENFAPDAMEFLRRFTSLNEKYAILIMGGVKYQLTHAKKGVDNTIDVLTALSDMLPENRRSGRPASDYIPWIVKEVYDFAITHPDYPVNVSTIADDLDVSRTQVYRYFRKIDPEFFNSTRKRSRRTRNEKKYKLMNGYKAEVEINEWLSKHPGQDNIATGQDEKEGDSMHNTGRDHSGYYYGRTKKQVEKALSDIFFDGPSLRKYFDHTEPEYFKSDVFFWES